MRQALAGMLWSKQCYYFDLDVLAAGARRPPAALADAARAPATRRGSTWSTTTSSRCPTSGSTRGTRRGTSPSTCVAAGDGRPRLRQGPAATSCCRSVYLHPSGQMPAYEWNFGDVNPPVHAFATLFLHTQSSGRRRDGRRSTSTSSESRSRKLLLNFTWWVNRKDPGGQQRVRGRLPRPRQHRRVRSQRAAPDRRQPRAGGRHGVDGDVQPEHARARARARRARPRIRGLRAQVRRALLLDRRGDRSDRRTPGRDVGRGGRASSTTCCGCPDGTGERLKVRSLVGLLPLCAVTVIAPSVLERFPGCVADASADTSSATATCSPPSRTRTCPASTGAACSRSSTRTSCAGCSTRMLDEERFFGPHGIRSLSRWHLDHPYDFDVDGHDYRVQYEPAESTTGMFGGNSNWRGPGVVPDQHPDHPRPAAALPLLRRHFKIECPTGSGVQMTLFEVARGDLPTRLASIVPPRRATAAAGLRRHEAVPGGPALAGPDPVLRVLPRRQRRRSRRVPPDRLDGHGRPTDPALGHGDG